jgi:hypothetical protein
MRITNISISEFPDSLRVFATHGLYYGMWLILVVEYPVSHDAANCIRLLAFIESDRQKMRRIRAYFSLAAKHINGIARKARIWTLLNNVEEEVGYHTRTTVMRLQSLVERGY